MSGGCPLGGNGGGRRIGGRGGGCGGIGSIVKSEIHSCCNDCKCCFGEWECWSWSLRNCSSSMELDDESSSLDDSSRGGRGESSVPLMGVTSVPILWTDPSWIARGEVEPNGDQLKLLNEVSLVACWLVVCWLRRAWFGDDGIWRVTLLISLSLSDWLCLIGSVTRSDPRG